MQLTSSMTIPKHSKNIHGIGSTLEAKEVTYKLLFNMIPLATIYITNKSSECEFCRENIRRLKAIFTLAAKQYHHKHTQKKTKNFSHVE